MQVSLGNVKKIGKWIRLWVVYQNFSRATVTKLLTWTKNAKSENFADFYHISWPKEKKKNDIRKNF